MATNFSGGFDTGDDENGVPLWLLDERNMEKLMTKSREIEPIIDAVGKEHTGASYVRALATIVNMFAEIGTRDDHESRRAARSMLGIHRLEGFSDARCVPDDAWGDITCSDFAAAALDEYGMLTAFGSLRVCDVRDEIRRTFRPDLSEVPVEMMPFSLNQMVGSTTSIDNPELEKNIKEKALPLSAMNRVLTRMAADIVDSLARKADASLSFKLGDHVRIHGLNDRPQYNGREAIARAFEASIGEQAVQLDSKEVINVRPENLELRPWRDWGVSLLLTDEREKQEKLFEKKERQKRREMKGRVITHENCGNPKCAEIGLQRCIRCSVMYCESPEHCTSTKIAEI
jgi:hypothetical protein